MFKYILLTLFLYSSLTIANDFSNIDYIRKDRNGKYMIIAKQNGKYGIFDLSGKAILKPQFNSIGYSQDSLYHLQKDNLLGVIDMQLDTIIPLKYTSISPLNKDHFYEIRKDHKVGVFDQAKKRIVIPASYDAIKPNKEYHRKGANYATAIVVINNDSTKQCALINLDSGKFIFDLGEYDYIDANDEYGCAIVSKDEMYAVISLDKKVLVPFSKERIEFTPLGYKKYNPNSKMVRFISKDGHESKEYDQVGFNNVVIQQVKSGIINQNRVEITYIKQGVINQEGKEILAPIYDQITINKDYIKTIIHPTEYGASTFQLFDLEGNKLSAPLKYHNIQYYPHSGVIVISNKGNEGLISPNGKKILPLKYRRIYVDDINERIILETHQLKMGLANQNGKILAKPQYDNISEFNNGVAEVGIAKGKKYLHGLINLNGEKVLKPLNRSFFFNMDKEKKYAITYQENKVGVICVDGRTTVKPIYDDIIYNDRTDDDWALVAITKLNHKMGLVDISTGKILIEPNYKYIFTMGKGDSVLFCLQSDDKQTIVNKTGKIVIPPTPHILTDLAYGKSNLIRQRTMDNNRSKVGIINNRNEIIIPTMYDGITRINDQLYCVMNDGKYGIINNKNKIVVPIEYDYIAPYSYSDAENLLLAVKDQKTGFLIHLEKFEESPFAKIILDEKQTKMNSKLY